MKTLYFDCSSGISGNMTLGALIEIIGDETYLLNELKKLNVSGYDIKISKTITNGITATYVDVILQNHNHHEHRHLEDINNIIDISSLDDNVKDLSKRIFMRVAKAESKVHNVPLNEVHFHEVGAIDSIVDIVGTAILINKIKPEKIVSSIVNDGYGFIKCAHGTISVPVPATSEILASTNVKFRQIDIDTELVTPTGAAIIAELASCFSPLPTINVERIGWGAGLKELKIPNVLKVYLGEADSRNNEIVVMETNIDDCSPEILGYVQELLLASGALDVFYAPIYMKKNRPAYTLTVICKENKVALLQDIIFKETTSIGIRFRIENRTELARKQVEITTPYGNVLAKEVTHNTNTYIYPEYESLKAIALANNIPLKDLYKYGKDLYTNGN